MYNSEQSSTRPGSANYEHAIELAAERKSDLSLAATLLSLFDFSATGQVTQEDWERGLSTLLLGGLSQDIGLWQQLLDRYDPHDTGAVQLERVRDVLPIDPRISVLLQQLVHSVAGCREYVASATKKQNKEVEMRSQRAVINLRKRLLEPIFAGWRDVIRAEKTLKRRAARFMRSSSIGKAWRTWNDVCENAELVAKKRQRMAKMLRRMQQRGVSKALNQWLDMWEERKVRLDARAASIAPAPAHHLATRPAQQPPRVATALSDTFFSLPPPARSGCKSSRVVPSAAASPARGTSGQRWLSSTRV